MSQALTQLHNATQENIRLRDDVNLLRDQLTLLTTAAVTQHNISQSNDQETNTSLEDVRNDINTLHDQLSNISHRHTDDTS